MPKIYRKAIAIQLNFSLLHGLGKGVEVIPLAKSFALQLLYRKDNYEAVYLTHDHEILLPNEMNDFIDKFDEICNLKKNDYSPTFIDEENDFNWDEFLYIEPINESYYIIKPL